MPGAVLWRPSAAFRRMLIDVRLSNPVAGIRGVRPRACAAVRDERIGNEAVARQQAAARRSGEQVRVVVTNARIEVGDHERGTPRRRIPRGHRVDRRRRRGRVLQIPLLGQEQRIVRCGVRVAPLVDLGVFDLRVRPQGFEGRGERFGAERELQVHHMHSCRDRPGALQHQAVAPSQQSHPLTARFDLRLLGCDCSSDDGGSARGLSQFDDQPLDSGIGCAMRVRADRVELVVQAGGAEYGRHQHRPG